MLEFLVNVTGNKTTHTQLSINYNLWASVPIPFHDIIALIRIILKFI